MRSMLRWCPWSCSTTNSDDDGAPSSSSETRPAAAAALSEALPAAAWSHGGSSGGAAAAATDAADVAAATDSHVAALHARLDALAALDCHRDGYAYAALPARTYLMTGDAMWQTYTHWDAAPLEQRLQYVATAVQMTIDIRLYTRPLPAGDGSLEQLRDRCLQLAAILETVDWDEAPVECSSKKARMDALRQTAAASPSAMLACCSATIDLFERHIGTGTTTDMQPV